MMTATEFPRSGVGCERARSRHEPASVTAQWLVQRFGDRPTMADVGAIEDVDVDMRRWRELARRDQAFAVVRMDGILQADSGDESLVVRPRPEACGLACIAPPDPRPVDV